MVAVSSRSGSVPCSRSWPTRAAIAYGGDGGELALPPELRHRARQRVDHLGGLTVSPHLVGVAPGQAFSTAARTLDNVRRPGVQGAAAASGAEPSQPPVNPALLSPATK